MTEPDSLPQPKEQDDIKIISVLSEMPHNNVRFVTDVSMTPDLSIGTCRQASV
jgi:hypothetical protein